MPAVSSRPALTTAAALLAALALAGCSGRDTEMAEKLAAANAAADRAEAAAQRAEAAAGQTAYKAAATSRQSAPVNDPGEDNPELAGEPDPSVGAVD